MTSFENRVPDTQTVKQSADFYEGAFNIPKDIRETYEKSMNEKVNNIINSTSNEEGKLIESMDNVDLLPRENELKEKIACASLFNQVNNYFESCSAA